MDNLSDDEREASAKEFQRAFNRSPRPRSSFRRLAGRTPGAHDSFDSENGHQESSTHTGGLTMEDVPVYRELEEWVPKWRRVFNRVCPQPIRSALKPPISKEAWMKFMFVHLPIIHWVWQYTPKQLIGDTIAGLTIGVTHIPQGIGFALLASLPPAYGLYSSFLPVIIYSIFGTSRHISVGTFPVVALLTGDTVIRLTSEYPPCNASMTDPTAMMDGNSSACAQSLCDAYSMDIAVTLSLMVGIIMIVMSLFKLGVITLLLSDALISGYTAAAAFSIVVTQVLFLFGLDPSDSAVPSGLFVTPRRLIRYLELIFTGQVTPAAIVTSIICIIIIIVIDIVNKLLKKYIQKIPIYIPAQLIVVVLSTGVAYGGQLSTRFNLTVISDLGGIPPGECFTATVPRGDLILTILQDAFIIAIISFVINISQAKLLAQKNNYIINADQELFAYGTMNFGGAFLGSFPTAGALSRTVLQDATGGNTQLVGLISSFIVLMVILFLGGLFATLPSACVAAIVVMALKGLIFQVRDIRKYYLLSLWDMAVWLVVFTGTLIIGLDIGLGIGILFSLLTIIIRTILPFSFGLGEAKVWLYPREKSNPEFGSCSEEDLLVRKIPGVYVYQFNAPLYFANVGVFLSRLYLDCGLNPLRFEQQEKGCFQQCYEKIRSIRTGIPVKRPSSPVLLESRPASTSPEELDTIQLITDQSHSTEYSNDVPSPKVDRNLSYVRPVSMSRSELIDLAEPRATDYYHTVIIDCGPIVFVDSMGLATIEKLVADFDKLHVQVLLAAPTTPLCNSLHRYGFFKRFSAERLFPTVLTAVDYAKQGKKVPNIEKPGTVSKVFASNLERQLLFTRRPTLLELQSVDSTTTGAFTIPESIETAV